LDGKRVDFISSRKIGYNELKKEKDFSIFALRYYICDGK